MKRLLPFLLLFASCQRSSQWAYFDFPTREERVARIRHQSSDPIRGIDVEFLKVEGEPVALLSLHSTPIGTKSVTLHLITEEKVYSFIEEMHEGCQRLRLSPSCQKRLIEELLNERSVTIKLEGYRETLAPQSFEKALKKMKTPPTKIPIHLPI